MPILHRQNAAILLAGTRGNVFMEYLGLDFYHTAIAPLALVTGILGYLALPSKGQGMELPKGFSQFQASYLAAWALCVGADWLQGPYVYALYEAYGFKPAQIAQLFVAGFGSALAFSCFVGSLADRFGRKKGCLAYCFFYIVSCMTKHFKNYWVLMLGRITGGLATSLLFSCFECWMVSEHTKRNAFPSRLLSNMFGMQYTVMYLVAILSGFCAQGAAGAHAFAPISGESVIWYGGNISPFDLSAVLLLVAMVYIALAWDENYGQSSDFQQEDTLKNFQDACSHLVLKPHFMQLCVVSSCFEGAMYAFVFNWTPALQFTNGPTPPYGIIFSLFMMACMCGASTATLISSKTSSSLRLAGLIGAAVISFGLASCTSGDLPPGVYIAFISFLIFEFCVGMYFPSMGILKSEIVPEHIRGTLYNLYRVPLNAVVVCLLLTNLDSVRCFRICAGLLGIAFVATVGLMRKMPAHEDSPEVTKMP